MIAKLIELSTRNRALVVILTVMLVGAGIWSLDEIKLDAIPDLSDVQVIVTTEFPGQNPEVVDDQVTYPISTAMLAVPGSTVVRGFSMFEQSFVYVLFQDGTDLSWARGRVLESFSFVRDRLPKGVEPRLGPDATGVGWVYQYALFPGWYSPDHPTGLWHDAASNRWYAARDEAPAEAREKLVHVRAFEKPGNCPLTAKPLVAANLDLAQMRGIQDWYLRFPLTAVDGVSEVASIGGFVKQYQVIVDSVRLSAWGIPVTAIGAAIERSNRDVGGSVIELSENEYMVRSRAYLKGVEDLENVPLSSGIDGTPVRLGDVASVQIGGEARRGAGELDGIGEAVGGIVVARFGENAHQVIEDVKAKLVSLEVGLPPGVIVKPTYDRSQLIDRSIATLTRTLLEEILVVGLVCILFLLHARSELVAVFVVPASLVVALWVMHLVGVNANIMSLGGIAISIGVVVDSAIVMVENGHKHLDREEERVAGGESPRPRSIVIAEAAKEVGPQLFFSLLVITVSFLPVFVLGGEAGRLFTPLAFTKTLAMAAAAILSVTIVPVLMISFITSRVLPARLGRRTNVIITLAAMLLPAAMLWVVAARSSAFAPYAAWIASGWAVFAAMLLVPQKIVHENRNPLSHVLQRVYEPVFRASMRHPWLVLVLATGALASAAWPLAHLGTEFMPALDEGDLLYMPTTDPSVSITKSRELLQQTDRWIKSFPEVLSVHGKIGRAETATDPAPLSMIETVVHLEPDHERWRRRQIERFFDEWPDWMASRLARVWPRARPITTDELKFGWNDADGKHHDGLNDVVSMPGIANAWPYPIENRINMLATGIKTPLGIKVLGPDVVVLADLAERAAVIARSIQGTASAYSERATGGLYLDVDVDRAAAARHGLSSGDVQDVVQTAIGGMNVATVVDGLQRYPVNVRFARELRDDVPALERVLVPTPKGSRVPLASVAHLSIHPGVPMIRSENAQRTAWVYVDVQGRDLGGYVADARARIARELTLPPGYSVVLAGQFELFEKTIPRLIGASLLALVLIVVLLYMSSQSWFRVGVILLAVPFSLIGALWLLYGLDYHLSLAVVIGMIALAGLDAETGMIMLLYLDSSCERFAREGRLSSRADLMAAVHDGAVKRIRPKAMTVSAAFIGLVPIFWAEGSGSDVMRRLAAPLVGGLAVSFALELVVYPVVFYLWKRREFLRANELPLAADHGSGWNTTSHQ